MPSPSPESTAIEAAYQVQVETLFKTLCANLIDEPNQEQQCVARFTAGLGIAKRAKALALGAATALLQEAQVARRVKAAKKK